MLTISFTGDICFNGNFKNNLESGFSVFEKPVSSFLMQQQFICCNFEGPETNVSHILNNNTPLKNHTGAISYLSNYNFNIFNLANNHICDYKKTGLTDTINIISDIKQSFVGAGINKNAIKNPVVISQNDISIALLAYCEKDNKKIDNCNVAYLPSINKLKTIINKLKADDHKVILMYHGGEEFTTLPSPAKRKLLKKIAEKTKIDAIVAHHSHVFQGVEIVNLKPVFYSLGNFIFDLINHEIYPQSKESAILSLQINKTNISYDFFPVVCNSNKGVVEKGDNNFIETIKHRSDFSNYKKKWQKQCYNIIFNRPVHKVLNPQGESLQKKSFIKILLSKKFYKQIIKILINNKLRDVYFNAFLYKLTGNK